MKDIKKIVCALDLSPHSAQVAEYTVTLAKALDADVLVVYVAPVLTQYLGLNVDSNSIDHFAAEIVTGAEKNMREFVELHFKDIRAEAKVLTGYASEEILAVAQSAGANLIVMGTHGHKGIDRIIFGSVAEQIVKSSPIPVLTVRPEN
ncbi:universal stress protein [Desulfovibrio sp. OttesenSCG-928-O18]|nr:universal stress protein [Desulfovibrio sp. OttesenSCG-928-O18]